MKAIFRAFTALLLLKSGFMTVQNIKREIELLSPGEDSELHARLNQQEQDEATVDMQLKGDVDAGKFDNLIDEAIADDEAQAIRQVQE